MYGIGCVPTRFSNTLLKGICGDHFDNCKKAKSNGGTCHAKYSSGPPWIIHRSDAEDVFSNFINSAILTHEGWPDMLAEQGSFGITQMMFGIENHLDAFWFLSAPNDGMGQPWRHAAAAKWDPCKEQKPPPVDLPLPPLWHACSTFEIPHLKGQGFRLHKDHIHKDVLDCDAPLLHFPPKDALEYYKGQESTLAWRHTWSVCTYTNMVNWHVTEWKKLWCKGKQINLSPTFKYPDHAQPFINQNSPIKKTFRRGGWTDVDYQLGKSK
jgi:hypothetical protein